MNTYYTSVELGTNSIKILVCNKFKNKFHVIASVDTPSEGIQKGMIVDTKKAITTTKKAFRKLDEMLGFKITEGRTPLLPSTDFVLFKIPSGSTLATQAPE